MEWVERCPICGASDPHLIFQVEDRLYKELNLGKGEVVNRVHQCPECGVGFLSPRFDQGELLTLYDAWYESHPEMKSLNSSFSQRKIRAFRRYHMRKLRRLSPRKGRVLDVGCGGGLFLYLCQREGWEVHGVELSRKAVEFAVQLLGDKVKVGIFRETEYPVLYFDVISMFDYIEHTRTPLEDLIHARELLKRGGILIGTTPNWRSLQARWMGKEWVGIISDHLFYYTPQSLRGVLRRAGFEVLEIEGAPLPSLKEILSTKVEVLKRRLQKGRGRGVGSSSAAARPALFVYGFLMELLDYFGTLMGQGNILWFAARRPV
ncbi:MAG: hypothetical protein DRN81_03330 [Thermoproteota archaeon]|nr:MAG: hypothetical protein DRN81_03330 [Candidatus Korarchaeota archaeon]